MSASADRESRPVLAPLVRRAIAVASLASLVQLAFVYRKVQVKGTFAWASRDIYWMSPLANIALLVGLVLVLWMAGAWMRRCRTSAVVDTAVGAVGGLAALLVVGGLSEWAVLLLAIGVGVQWGRMREGQLRRVRDWVTMAGVAIGVACVVGGLLERATRSRRAGDAVAAVPDGPNVLLIIWDTVRAANLGAYGYGRATTPELDQLAKSGATWNWAMAPAPWTLPSHCSMFTGRHPGEHSCRWDDPLRGAPETVAAVFRRQGWRTGGFVANPFYTTHETGLQHGFDVWEDFRLTPRQLFLSSTLMQTAIARDLLMGDGWAGRTRAVRQLKLRGDPKPLSDRKLATHVTDQFLAWQGRDTRPFFAVLNLFDAHDPYDPPAPWATRFSAQPDRVALYDGGIAYMDDELGRLVKTLEERGILDNTIVVVTSDHGEMFGEHDLGNHGHALYMPLLHVPLVVRYPARLAAGARSEATVGLRDLAATLLDLAGIGATPGIEGRSFVATAGAGRDTTLGGNLALAETEQSKLFWTSGPARHGAMHSLIDDAYHYIRDGKGREELYRYREDRPEANDLAASDSSRTAWYRARLGTISRQLVR
ncbi:MAG: sulfatase [Gemmatimonadetes bacterium]|nr:sulfatase [Gemmatimonadota bacterium]